MLQAVHRILYGILVGVCIRCGARDPDFTEPDQPCDVGENCPSKAFRVVPCPSNWAHAGIDYCVKNKLMNGVGDDSFSPEGKITREQIAAILYRYSGSPEVEGSLSTFPDAASVSAYAVNALIWATQQKLINGITSGNVTNLAPGSNTTRAQIAVILERWLE